MKNIKAIVWFAKGGGIAKNGPFGSQIEAVNSMRLEPQRAGYGVAEDLRLFPDDVFVWPEEVEVKNATFHTNEANKKSRRR